MRFLRARPFSRRLYFLVRRPKGGIIHLEWRGYRPGFFVGSFPELRAVENFLRPALSEGFFLDALLESLGRGDIAYDIGANIGLHTIFMAMKVGPEGRVVAFEPERTNYARLLQNVRLNSLNNVVAVPVALGEAEETLNLYARDRIGIGGFTLSRRGDGRFSQLASVVPGDRLISERGLPPPQAVKIDVEGFELAVIKGLHRALADERCRLACCEIHPPLLPAGYSSASIMEMMKNLGFFPERESPRGGEIHVIFRKRIPGDIAHAEPADD